MNHEGLLYESNTWCGIMPSDSVWVENSSLVSARIWAICFSQFFCTFPLKNWFASKMAIHHFYLCKIKLFNKLVLEFDLPNSMATGLHHHFIIRFWQRKQYYSFSLLAITVWIIAFWPHFQFTKFVMLTCWGGRHVESVNSDLIVSLKVEEK